MDPNLYLHGTGVFLGYFLKITAAYFLCQCLVRLVRRPQHRFLIWLTFLLASGLYWVGLLGAGWMSVFHRSATLVSGSMPAPLTPTSTSLLVPAHWSQFVASAGIALGWTYVGGVFLLACRKGWKHIRLRFILKFGMPPSAEVAALFHALCRDFGVRRCELMLLPNLSSPATAYCWKPRVFLPEVCEDPNAVPQLAGVLGHELVHIVRRDYLWATISELVCDLLFFHPAVWHARKQMQLQRELACDQTVVETWPERRADYADSLARFVRLRMMQPGVSLGVDFAASASFLGMRVRGILAEPAKVFWWKKLSAATAGIFLLAIFGIACPSLSVLIAFAGEPQLQVSSAMQPAVRPVRGQTAHRGRNGKTREIQDRPQADLFLTNLRVHNSIRETPDYSFTGTQSKSSTAADLDKPAWRESSPTTPSFSKPSVTSILRSTAGEIAGERRGGRSGGGGHDHDHDDRDNHHPGSPQ